MAALTLSRSAAALAHVGAGAIGGGAGRWRTQGQPGRAVGDGAGHWGDTDAGAEAVGGSAATLAGGHAPTQGQGLAHVGGGWVWEGIGWILARVS